MFSQKALYIDAVTGSSRIEEIRDESIIGPLDFGMKEVEKNPSSFCFGSGVLAGSILPGAKRLIFCGNSEIWENFYISTMGGAAYIFHRTGVNYVCITGKADTCSVLIINRKDGNVSCRFEPVDAEEVWNDYYGLKGTYALQKYCFDRYKDEFKECRILVTGPSALKTKIGAIMSAPVTNNAISPVDCWGGRGGLGSKLVREHRIAAIIYGGDYEETNEDLKDRAKIDSIFMEKFGKNMIMTDLDKGKKYRFDPDYNTGGTLGVNLTTTKTRLFSFNYTSIYRSEEQRMKLHNEFIAAHYLKQFNEDTIQKKQSRHCGEPCGLVCKKMNGEFKKDYEPYEALGPNAGIFDQHAAEMLNHHVDAMGFDAIQAGSLVSWIMELLHLGLVRKEDLGIMLEPKFDPDNFDVVADSMNNANLGIEIINMVLFSDKGEMFRHGIRYAAKELDERMGIESIKHAVFNAYGEHGCMVPNQYWVPGMFSPMPIMGKYFEYYGSDVLTPRELGKKNAERMIREFAIDNMGFCRFHRGWAEPLLERIVNIIFGTNIDFFDHHKKLAAALNRNNRSVFWESERVVDIIKGYLEITLEHNPDNNEMKEWVDEFRKHKFQAARRYWNEILEGVDEALRG